MLARVANHGPVTSAEVGEGEERGKGGWWDWHPSNAVLEYLWRVGEISVTRRDGFRKVYDLTERVLPQAVRSAAPTLRDSTDWACNSALDHLGFGTSGEIAAYWGAVAPDAAKGWCAAGLATGSLIRIAVEGADGTPRPAFARPDVVACAANAPPPPNRLRILSPFDPALRDRKRTERLFGFHYRIKVFVPAPQRRYGYYVLPVLEGDRLVGRLEPRRTAMQAPCTCARSGPNRGFAWGQPAQNGWPPSFIALPALQAATASTLPPTGSTIYFPFSYLPKYPALPSKRTKGAKCIKRLRKRLDM